MKKPSMLDHALAAAERFGRVFPVVPHGKKPAIQKWPEKATRDPEQIRQWWSRRDYNIGVVCEEGRSVLDIDVKSGGKRSLVELLTKHGALKTLVVETPSGGFHLWLAGDLPNSASKVGKGLDTRGSGKGFVVAPGSVIDGREYRILHERPMAPVPGWLAELAEPSRNRAGVREERDVEVAEGVREATLVSYLGTLRNQGMPPEQMRTFAEALNEAHFVPPLEPDALDRVLGSASKWKPGTVPLIVDARRVFKADPTKAIELPPAEDYSEVRLPAEFWTLRPSLQRIRDAAWATLNSPDAVLGSVYARWAAMLPGGTTIHTGKAPARLIAYSFLVGEVAAGKTDAARAARELFPVPLGLDCVDGGNPGSGEGIPGAYCGQVKVVNPLTKRASTDYRQVRRNALLFVDEGEKLVKLAERPGSTVQPILNTMFMGDPLHHLVNSADRRMQVDDYSLGLIVGVQPRIGTLLAQAGEDVGLPQRFLWWNANLAADTPEDERGAPEPFDTAALLGHGGRASLDALTAGEAEANEDLDEAEAQAADTAALAPEDPPELFMAPELRAAVRARLLDEKKRRVPVAPLDRHALLIRCRFAAFLAAMEGRDTVNAEDWALAEQVWSVSAALQRAVIARGQAAQDEARRHQAEEAGELDALRRQAATVTPDERAARQIARAVRREGRIQVRDMWRTLHSRYRKVDGLDLAIERGWVRADGDWLGPGPASEAA